jgi:MscS family membrane protein
MDIAVRQHIPVRPALIAVVICIMVCLLSGHAFAQKPLPLSRSTEAVTPVQSGAALDDPLGRSTPEGTVLGFMREAEREDYEQAIEYLDTRQPPRRAKELAAQLQVVLNQGFSVNLTKLSRKPEGDLGDGLRSTRERIGVARTSSRSYDIILERVQRNDDPPVWLFSAETLKVVPEIYRELKHNAVERYVPGFLKDNRLWKYPLWQWLALALMIPVSFLLAWFVTWALLFYSRFVSHRRTEAQNEQRRRLLKGPVSVLALSLGSYVASYLSYSLLSRLFWTRVSQTLFVVGLTWLCLHLIDPVIERLWDRRVLVTSSGRIAVVRLFHKVVKVLVVIAGAVCVFYIAGINLTAVLTGLGIGGIAIAFAAQKTLENLFGGVMLISDQPVRVGDFCRAGEYMGTVEDIGLRSTRLRTLGRTVVSIPNGQLATMSLENYTLRDKVLFRHRVQLRYETSPDQLRYVIAGMRRLFYEHPRVETEGSRVRFTGLKDSGLELEVYAYILESDYAAFLAVQEDLLLRFMSIIEESGTSFAFPSQTTYVARDAGLDKAKGTEASETIRTWRERGTLPFPDFAPDDIAGFADTLEYPPRGRDPGKKE